MTQNIKNWILALGYLALIYATLGIVGIPLGYLRSHGLLRISLAILYGSCVMGVLIFLLRHPSTEKWRYAALIIIFFIYYFTSRYVQSPEEQIHFFQYGLVGVLFYRALHSIAKNPAKAFTMSLILATLAGWMDEIIQGLLPNRHYDIRDIYLNAVSAFLGLLAYRLILPSHPTKIKIRY